MSTADAQIADFALTPVTKQAPQQNTSVALAAKSLFEVFGSTGENKSTRVLVDLVLGGLTYEEYNDAEKAALKLAAEYDKLAGWEPKEGVKGRGAYGPKQSSMASRASERRQVFGAIKQGGVSLLVSLPPSGVVNYDTLPVFSQAVQKAREYLRNPTGAPKGEEQPVDWTGRPTEDKRREKADLAEAALSDKVVNSLRAKLPKDKEETQAAWMLRLLDSEEYASAMEEAQSKSQAALVAKVYAALVKEHGQDFVFALGDYITTEALKAELAE